MKNVSLAAIVLLCVATFAFAQNRVPKELQDRLKQMCSFERPYCWSQASLFCVGNKHSLQARTSCPCSCAEIGAQRYRKCCEAMTVPEECLGLCAYNVTGSEFIFPAKMLKCNIHYHKILYCGAEGRDLRRCCKKSRVPKECIHICNADREYEDCNVKPQDNIMDYVTCLSYTDVVNKCAQTRLEYEPKFNLAWKRDCKHGQP